MAPEQLIRGGVVDKRTDVYAAGVVLYELLTGERLFIFPEGADYKQIARIVTKGEFIPVSQRDPNLDPSLDPIVGKALAPRADDRYQTCEEFRDAIQAKLYQMNPTISGDALAGFVRGLFGEEMEEERAMIASTRTVDLAEFQDQLSGSATHTVTFARAGLFGRQRTQSSAQVPAVEASGSMEVVKRSGVVIGAAAAAMVLGGILVFFVARRALAPAAPPVPPPVVVVKEVPKVVAPPPVKEAPKPKAVVTPLPEPPPSKGSSKPRHGPARVAKAEPSEAPAPKRTHDQVEAKFKTVKHEYDSFKGEYGGRLESQWNAITNAMVFGSGDAKYEKVDAMLDSLRREMAKVRDGG
jgi:hypothetical protein